MRHPIRLLKLGYGKLRHGMEPSRSKNGNPNETGRLCIFSLQEGSALVEMALTIPILLTIFTGAASFSMGFYKMQQLGYANAAATQQVSSLAGETTDPCAQIVTTVTTSLPGWSSGSLNYKAVITDSTGATHTYPSTGMAGNTFSCTAAATLMGANEPIVVSVSYAYNWIPILQFTQTGNLYSTEAGLME